MRRLFSLRQRNYYPWLFLGLVIIANGVLYRFLPLKASPELFLSVTGSVAALVHFFYSQYNHSTDRFIELFKDFNARYDHLNNKLNALVAKDGGLVLTPDDTLLLFDYFNLCAEEYLYFKSGYIDIDVWQSWLNGMRYFASNPEIRRIWLSELQSGSYYGFPPSLLSASP